MNRRKDPIIVYAGRYNSGEKLSGPEKTAKRIFTEHTRNKSAVFIQYFFDGRKYGFMKKLFGNETDKPGKNATVMTLGLFNVFRALRQLRPDIIHIITFERFAFIIILYSMFHKTKVMYNVHGAVSYENKELKKVPFLQRMKDRFCEKLFLSRSDKLVFNSDNTIDLAEKYFRFDESKVVILPNGIDKEFCIESSTTMNTPPLKAVIMIKNELSRTGFEFLSKFIDNAEMALDIYIISDSEHGIKPAKKISISCITPMPAVELAEFYRDKDIFLSLNQYDTFSISTAEAMAGGLIPIITSQTGINRYVDNGHNGFIVDYGDCNSLNEAMNIINGNTEDGRQLIKNNARTLYESLAWNKVYEMYLELYVETAA